MRIRLFRAFASNNSGSYTIVGSFRAVDTAKDVAKVLRDITAEHDAWFRSETGRLYAEGDPPSPMQRFAREHGLIEEQPGHDQDWPEFGEPPVVITSGAQVIVYVNYTVTMPSAFGEYFYKRGGRVSREMEHSHRPIAVELAFNPGAAMKSTTRMDDVARRVTVFRETLDPVLKAHSKRADYDERPPIGPAWYTDFDHGVPKVCALFLDLPKAVEEVQRLADDAGFDTYVRLFELNERADPFAAFRCPRKNWGLAQVILWSVPEDPVQALQAVRSGLESTLQEAKDVVDALPVEVLKDVDEATAREVCARLRTAGCDAEVVTPREEESDH